MPKRSYRLDTRDLQRRQNDEPEKGAVGDIPEQSRPEAKVDKDPSPSEPPPTSTARTGLIKEGFSTIRQGETCLTDLCNSVRGAPRANCERIEKEASF